MRKRAEGFLLLGIVVLIAVIVSMTQREFIDAGQFDSSVAGRSSYRTLPEGYKALYLTLDELGYHSQRLTRPYQMLPETGGLLIVADPFRAEVTRDEGEHLLAWVAQGNHALVIVEHHTDVLSGLLASRRTDDEEMLAEASAAVQGQWLTQVATPSSVLAPKTPTTDAKATVPSFLSAKAPTLAVRSHQRFKSPVTLSNEAVETIGGVVPLYRDPKGMVVGYSQVGQGGIVWHCSPWSFSNAGIDQADNLAFVLALAERSGGRVIFDEYHQGYGANISVWSLLPPGAKLGLAQIAIALVLLLITLGWRFGPSQLPIEERVSRSRAEYLTAMAGLLERARATHVVRERLSTLLRRELGRRLGLPPSAAPERFLAANATHLVVDRALLERVFRQLEAAAQQRKPDPETLMRLAGDIHRLLHRTIIAESGKEHSS